eukprot:gb/GECG01015642.1/.p1 GENE.gb/GECG01015642.1/~~gb/GECG01015642.1/.p1  ORF type:complete len:347 (+),score=30.88 gb/GECG01015642.1/:1-1041(+)
MGVLDEVLGNKEEQYPPFDPNRPRFDQTHYWGRFRHFLQVVNPLTLLNSQEKVYESRDFLKKWERGELNPSEVTNKDLWEAKRIRDAAIHPDTGEIIPFYFRMSFFVPINIPIAAGMTLWGNTTPSQLFWQWTNQSYNAGMNYGNRNATLPVSPKDLAVSYVGACSIACGVAFGFGKWSNKIAESKRFGPTVTKLIQRFVPFTAVALAGAGNVAFMRYNNVRDGIRVYDEFRDEQGTSITAGRIATGQAALTRMVLPIPIILFPPYVLDLVKRSKMITNAVAKNPRLNLPLELAVVAVCLTFALPAAIAVFPQESEVEATKLEPQYHNLKDREGKPIQKLYFNKGL